MKRLTFTLWALLAATPAWAVSTDTVTPSLTPTYSASPTPTPGSGSLAVMPDGFILGLQSSGFDITYNTGSKAWPATGGILELYFPLGLGTPGAGNFYISPGHASSLLGYVFNGLTVTVQLKDLSPGQSIILRYGMDASGILPTQSGALLINASAYPESLTLGAGGALKTPIVITVLTATVTPTYSATVTVSQTPTETPTTSETHTITPTFTESPVGAEQIGEIYSYPNPFDLRKRDKVTFRFPADSSAKLTVFNLAGEPVRDLSSSDINLAQGWALWDGRDDSGHIVAAGLYFVRLQASRGNKIRRFVVLR